MKAFIAAGLLLIAGNASAQSGDAPGQKGVTETFMHGRCSKLIAAGKDVTASCSPVLVNVDYPSGGSSFFFTLANQAIVSFFGRDSSVVGDHGMRYLQRVSFKDSTPNNPSSAVSGVCRFNRPPAGPIVVDCEADSKDGPFKAVFVTDGERPSVATQ